MIATAPENSATPAVLTDRQRQVFDEIRRYTDFAGEPPTVSYLARRMGVHWTTVREHLEVLERKGWLRTPRPWIGRHG